MHPAGLRAAVSPLGQGPARSHPLPAGRLPPLPTPSLDSPAALTPVLLLAAFAYAAAASDKDGSPAFSTPLKCSGAAAAAPEPAAVWRTTHAAPGSLLAAVPQTAEPPDSATRRSRHQPYSPQ
ncbi:hypothetical protein Vafri_3720 [Volvox africanus]|uniref:Uncharacterized protein n=1 Tax=Volvox africanus TaxID=51714 RepID=A0A8J4ET62_9CHLO|nr:hypothetical protein Vafri_3720 [Volvox africanus]